MLCAVAVGLPCSTGEAMTLDVGPEPRLVFIGKPLGVVEDRSPGRGTVSLGEPVAVLVEYGNTEELKDHKFVYVVGQPEPKGPRLLGESAGGHPVPRDLNFALVSLFTRVEGPGGVLAPIVETKGESSPWFLGELQARAHRTQTIVEHPNGLRSVFSKPGEYVLHWQVTLATSPGMLDLTQGIPRNLQETFQGQFPLTVQDERSLEFGIEATIAEAQAEIPVSRLWPEEEQEIPILLTLRNVGRRSWSCEVKEHRVLFSVASWVPFEAQQQYEIVRESISKSSIRKCGGLAQTFRLSPREEGAVHLYLDHERLETSESPGPHGSLVVHINLGRYLRFSTPGLYEVVADVPVQLEARVGEKLILRRRRVRALFPVTIRAEPGPIDAVLLPMKPTGDTDSSWPDADTTSKSSRAVATPASRAARESETGKPMESATDPTRLVFLGLGLGGAVVAGATGAWLLLRRRPR